MAARDSIELFQFIQNYLRAIGVHRPEPKQNDPHFFNSKNWIFILSGVPMLISSLAFFVYQAETAFDYGLTFYYSSCLVFGAIFYINYIWKVENISKFIENCETFIEQSKLNNYKHFDEGSMHSMELIVNIENIFLTIGLRSSIVYKKLNEKIKNIFVCFFIILLGELVISSISVLIYSVVSYFILNSGSESFLLCDPNV